MEFCQEIKTKIKAIEQLPGVYLFRDAQEQILYIGKAKNLRNRLLSYLSKITSDWKLSMLAEEATNIESHTTKNELQAFLLEAKLIQANQPKFNVLLKSGKPFLYFLFTNDNPSQLVLTRITSKKGEYFGPFLSSSQARKIYEALVNTFGLKICNRKIEGGCLYFHMGKCAGFCRKNFDSDRHSKSILLAKKLCTSGPKKFIAEANKKIKQLNKELRFEDASELSSKTRSLAASLEHFQEAEKLTSLATQELSMRDIWIFSEKTRMLCRCSSRLGFTKKEEVFFIDQKPSPELFTESLLSFYRQITPPLSIFTNFKIQDRKVTEQFLSNWHNITAPVIITDAWPTPTPDFLDFAWAIAEKENSAFILVPQKLQKMLGMKKPVKTIDCFDISHQQGQFQVGACVRFKNGRLDPSGLRKFKIKTISTQNDYRCLQEVVYRRYSLTNDFPDLILVDGGKGQLSAVQNIFTEVDFAALAKKEEIVFRPKNPDIPETLSSQGIKLNPKTPEGLLLISLRDKTHNFAVGYHRKLKNKF